MHADNWANKAKQEGYKTRAVYKLEEILKKISFPNDSKVLDLGSAPGGWSHYLKVNYSNFKIYAIDILPMDKIKDVEFFQIGIEDLDSINIFNDLINKFDLVISDIAPNLSGISSIDTENILELNKITIEAANKFLKLQNGTFIIKTFQNNNLKSLRKIMTSFFKDIQVIKPAASKKKSGEIYLVGVR